MRVYFNDTHLDNITSIVFIEELVKLFRGDLLVITILRDDLVSIIAEFIYDYQ